MASTFLEKKREAKEATPKPAPKTEIQGATPERVAPDSIDAYYLVGKGVYLTKDRLGEWIPFSDGEISRHLRNQGFFSSKEKWQAASEIDREMHRIQMEQNVHYAGELAGYPIGRCEIEGFRALITRARTIIQPEDVPYPILDTFFRTMLRKTLPFFLGWLKGSLQSLEKGNPWQPGQVLGLTGGVDCGKSLTQRIITQIFGGRHADPVPYLTGKTNFNADLFRAEHLAIGDKELENMSHVKRRQFAAKLKSLIVEPSQYVRDLFAGARMLTPFVRLTIATNETPEAMAIYPNPDDDVADKLLLLKCHTGELPARKDDKLSWGKQWEMIKAEIPGFLWMLKNWKIPTGIRDPGKRFTVKSLIAPELRPLILNLGKEERLFQLFDIIDIPWKNGTYIEGTSTEIEVKLRKRDITGELDRLAEHHAQFGYLLSRLCKLHKDRFKIIGEKGHQKIFRIQRGYISLNT